MLWRGQTDCSTYPHTPGCLLFSHPYYPPCGRFLSLQTEAPKPLIHIPPFLLHPSSLVNLNHGERYLICCASGGGSWLNQPSSLETESHPAVWNAEGEAWNDDLGAKWSREDHLYPHPDESHGRYGGAAISLPWGTCFNSCSTFDCSRETWRHRDKHMF